MSLLNKADVLLFKRIWAFVMSSEIVQESEWKKFFYSVSSLGFLRIEREEKRKYIFFIFCGGLVCRKRCRLWKLPEIIFPRVCLKLFELTRSKNSSWKNIGSKVVLCKACWLWKWYGISFVINFPHSISVSAMYNFLLRISQWLWTFWRDVFWFCFIFFLFLLDIHGLFRNCSEYNTVQKQCYILKYRAVYISHGDITFFSLKGYEKYSFRQCPLRLSYS